MASRSQMEALGHNWNGVFLRGHIEYTPMAKIGRRVHETPGRSRPCSQPTVEQCAAGAAGRSCQRKRVGGCHVVVHVSFRSNATTRAVTQGSGDLKVSHNAASCERPKRTEQGKSNEQRRMIQRMLLIGVFGGQCRVGG